MYEPFFTLSDYFFFSRKVRGGGDAKSSYISSAVSHLNY